MIGGNNNTTLQANIEVGGVYKFSIPHGIGSGLPMNAVLTATLQVGRYSWYRCRFKLDIFSKLEHPI